jgi:hypothetical protein
MFSEPLQKMVQVVYIFNGGIVQFNENLFAKTQLGPACRGYRVSAPSHGIFWKYDGNIIIYPRVMSK